MKITLKPNQEIWITSDTHYDHKNICSATTEWDINSRNVRKFESLDKMNATIVNNINNLVKPDDILISLGDWSFNGKNNIANFRNQIACQNIHLIYGNHDEHIIKDRGRQFQSLFTSTQQYLELSVDKQQYILFHYPIASWNNMSKGSIHLHGHIHFNGSIKLHPKSRSMDVGVDGNNYKPYSFTEINKIMADRPIGNLTLPNNTDHHL